MLSMRLTLAIGLVLTPLHVFAQQCALDAAPRVLEAPGNSHTAGARLAQVWGVDAAPVFWTTQPPTTGSYAGFVAAILAPVAHDYQEGWIVMANLHNHNSRLGQTDPNAVVSPSLPDAQLMQRLAAKYQLREAWITNGLHTARIPASAFARLQAAR